LKKKTPEELIEFGKGVRTADKRRRIKQIILALLISTFLFLGYKWFQGDFKFLFRSSDVVSGVVTDTNYYLWGDNKLGDRFYREEVFYEFLVDGKSYKGIWDVGKREGERAKGDSLQIQYAVSNPEVHEVIH